MRSGQRPVQLYCATPIPAAKIVGAGVVLFIGSIKEKALVLGGSDSRFSVSSAYKLAAPWGRRSKAALQYNVVRAALQSSRRQLRHGCSLDGTDCVDEFVHPLSKRLLENVFVTQ